METAGSLNQALNTSLGTFFISDTAGTALYANTAIERRTGYAIGEIIGKTPGKLWGGQMPRSFYNTLWTAIGGRYEPFVATVTNVRKDKTRYQELLAIAPIAKQGKAAPEYFIALQMGHLADRTERARFQKEFLKVFAKKNTASDEERLRYMFSALGSKYAPPAAEGKSLVEMFRETLIAPFAERFRARTEDRELVLAAQADPQRFQALYDKYHHMVFVYFTRHVSGNVEIAEDLVQDTFYRAFRYFENFRLTNASYGTYLLRVAHNVLVNHFRKQQFLSLIEEPVQEEMAPATSQFSLSEDALWQSPMLRATERKVLAMKYQEGFSVHEIATTIGKSENAVKLHLSRARKKLRTLLGA
ncbi:MAG: sigma-70 family RNA polymerase sigma factor [Candidatus Moraniibacteriota bacterium]